MTNSVLDERLKDQRRYERRQCRRVDVGVDAEAVTEPVRAGNPVFSVYQTDIIYYGGDLLSYFACEFHGVAKWHTPPLDVRPIRFWSELAG